MKQLQAPIPAAFYWVDWADESVPFVKAINETVANGKPLLAAVPWDCYALGDAGATTIAHFWNDLFTAWHDTSTVGHAMQLMSLQQVGVQHQTAVNLAVKPIRRFAAATAAVRAQGAARGSEKVRRSDASLGREPWGILTARGV